MLPHLLNGDIYTFLVEVFKVYNNLSKVPCTTPDIKWTVNWTVTMAVIIVNSLMTNEDTDFVRNQFPYGDWTWMEDNRDLFFF